MKTALTALVAFVALGSLSVSSIGCSSSSSGSGKEDIDTGSALSELRAPTGSFSASTAGSAFGNYRATRADSSKVATPGASTGGGTSTQSIRLLDRTMASSGSACKQGESCACPGGGSLSYTGGQTADGQQVNVTFDRCTFEDNFGFDGKAILLVSNKSLLGIPAEQPSAPSKSPAPSSAPPSDPSANSDPSGGVQDAPSAGAATTGSGSYSAASVLLAAKGTASYGSRKLQLAFALVTEEHYAFLAVKVADGSIVIGVSDTGDAIVKSKEGTWKCHSGSAGWTCTSDKGEKMNVAEEAPSEAPVASDIPDQPSSPAPAPAPAPSGGGNGSNG